MYYLKSLWDKFYPIWTPTHWSMLNWCHQTGISLRVRIMYGGKFSEQNSGTHVKRSPHQAQAIQVWARQLVPKTGRICGASVKHWSDGGETVALPLFTWKGMRIAFIAFSLMKTRYSRVLVTEQSESGTQRPMNASKSLAYRVGARELP